MQQLFFYKNNKGLLQNTPTVLLQNASVQTFVKMEPTIILYYQQNSHGVSNICLNLRKQIPAQIHQITVSLCLNF